MTDLKTKIDEVGVVSYQVGRNEASTLTIDIPTIFNDSVFYPHTIIDITSSSTISSFNNGTFYFVNATSGSITIRLPTPTNNSFFRIKRTDSSFNVINLIPYSGSYIDNDSEKIITDPYVSISLVGHNGNWWVY